MLPDNRFIGGANNLPVVTVARIVAPFRLELKVSLFQNWTTIIAKNLRLHKLNHMISNSCLNKMNDFTLMDAPWFLIKLIVKDESGTAKQHILLIHHCIWIGCYYLMSPVEQELIFLEIFRGMCGKTTI